MHSLAPWQVFKRHGIHYILDATNKELATVNGLEDGVNNEALAKVEEANARLFAAAPEMLAGLKCFLESIEGIIDGADSEERYVLDGIETDCKRLIAIAEGKNQ